MQNIEVIAPESQNRWGTNNTSVVACLLVYGFKLCESDPYIPYANYAKPEKIYYSLWLNPVHPLGLTWNDPDLLKERALTPQDFEVAWLAWNDVKESKGRYAVAPEWREPFILMRRGIEARHWAIRDIISPGREITFPKRVNPPGYKEYRIAPENRTLAFVCIALGVRLYGYVTGRTPGQGDFIFNESDALKVHQMYLQDGQNNAAQWAKRAIIQQDILMEDLKKEERKNSMPNVPKMVVRNGLNLGFLPVNAGVNVSERFWALING